MVYENLNNVFIYEDVPPKMRWRRYLTENKTFDLARMNAITDLTSVNFFVLQVRLRLLIVKD